ncbi:MAG: hypothetical protein ABIH92_03150 [Nanoarchaeota archaeon]
MKKKFGMTGIIIILLGIALIIYTISVFGNFSLVLFGSPKFTAWFRLLGVPVGVILLWLGWQFK